MRLFEAKAAGWAAKYAPDGPLAGRLASLSAAVSRYAQAGDRVLDPGCGTGELARALAAAGLWVAGCDISPQMLLRAPRHPCGDDVGGRTGWVQLSCTRRERRRDFAGDHEGAAVDHSWSYDQEDRHEPGRPVVVLGMHRSGTSVVAGIINLLGLPLCRDDDLFSGQTTQQDTGGVDRC